MPGRDVTMPLPGDLPRRPRRLAIGALVCVAILGIGVAIGSRIASPRRATSPTPAAVVPARPPTVPPQPASGQTPSASSAFAPTPAGAASAAASYVAAFDDSILLDPVRLRQVVSAIAADSSRATLLAVYAKASQLTRTRLGVDTVPKPVVFVRTIPVGYRIESYTAHTARVAVWQLGVVGSGTTLQPQQSWRTEHISLVWQHGTWKVSDFASETGPTPPLSNAQAASSPSDLFAAIPRFQEFHRAQP